MPTPTNPITSIKQYFTDHNGLQLANRFKVSFNGLPSGVILGDDSGGYVQAEYMALGPRAINTVQDNLSGFGQGRFVPRSQDILSGGFGVQLIFPITNDQHLLTFFNKPQSSNFISIGFTALFQVLHDVSYIFII